MGGASEAQRCVVDCSFTYGQTACRGMTKVAQLCYYMHHSQN
jgi:hypothetical protein